MNILLPSSGRRYLHIKYFKECLGVDKVITTDIDPLSPGIHAADKCYKVPVVSSDEYLPAILEICLKEEITVIIPLLDTDILIFSRNRAMFETNGIHFLLSAEETIEIALDKFATAEFLNSNSLPSPKTVIPNEAILPTLEYPVLIKPRFPALRIGKGYDISVITCKNDLDQVMSEITGNEENYVFQEYLTGEELSIDFFCDRNGKYIIDVPALRMSALTTAFSKNGGTMDKGKTFHDAAITEYIQATTRALKFFGPANYGGYRTKSGEILFTEINARLTGGATLAVKGSGIDLFQWSVDLLLGKEIVPPKGGFEEVYMTSYVMPICFKDLPQMIDFDLE